MFTQLYFIFICAIFHVVLGLGPEETTPKPDATSEVKTITILDQRNTKLPDRSVCGLEKEARKVVGGEVTDLGEFPWMAAIEYKSKLTGVDVGIKCGGSIINNRFILTAAHCLLDQEFEPIRVWLGDWNITSDPDCQELIANTECADQVLKLNIKKLMPHPYYSRKSGNNDIGLIELERDIAYTDFIRPICLPPYNLPKPNIGTPLTIAGWGTTKIGTSSDVKLKVNVPVLMDNTCREKLTEGKIISLNHLCAGHEQGKDSCPGDEGGPVMRSDQQQWYQEGVVSWSDCFQRSSPFTHIHYIRVTRYVNWIKDNLSDE